MRNKIECAIHDLKDAVKDLADEFGFVREDLYLLRWLKVKGMDVKKAERGLRDLVQWRKDRKWENLVTQNYHTEIAEQFPVYKTTAKDGMPVTMVQAGKIDVKGLMDKYGRDVLYEYIIQHALQDEQRNLEWTKRQLEQNNCKELTEASYHGNLFIFDMKDMAFSQLIAVKNVALAMQLSRDYVKHLAGLGYICIAVNFSKAVVALTNVFRKIIESPDITIEIYDQNADKWTKAIQLRVDVDEVPTIFGGNKLVPELL